jgi:hypothetical protein
MEIPKYLEMESAKRLDAIVAGSAAVVQYVSTQHDKGLLETIISVAATKGFSLGQIAYQTHWSTHKRILRPEIAQISDSHRLGFSEYVGRFDSEHGHVTPVETPRASDWVYVSLSLFCKE